MRAALVANSFCTRRKKYEHRVNSGRRERPATCQPSTMPTSCTLATTNRTGSTEQAAAFFLMERFVDITTVYISYNVLFLYLYRPSFFLGLLGA